MENFSDSRLMAIANAKLVLKQAGYYVDNLWSIQDVEDDSLTDEQKMSVLDMAFENEYINEEIFYAIGVGIEIITEKIK
jgi:hypothetical protein